MPNELTLLVTRGLDPSGYREPLTFQLHQESDLHHGLESCNIQQAATQQVTISPLKVKNLCSECWCSSLPKTSAGDLLGEAFVDAQPLWEAEQNTNAALSEDPVIALQKIWMLLEHTLHVYEHLPALATWLEDLSQRFQARQRELWAELQSPVSRQELLNGCVPAEKDQQVLIGVNRYWLPELDLDAVSQDVTSLPWQIRRIVAAWRLGEKKSWILLSVPERVAVLLREDPGQHGEPAMMEVVLTSIDTPAILETTLSLWEPESSGELRHLADALDAARRV